MVAVIRQGKSIQGALNYNEHKAKQGKASCLTAANYPKSAEELNFYQKLSRLQNLANLNLRAQIKCVHISLNFDPTEIISTGKMIDIARDYMQQIGFGEQPYLVYRHEDSGHPHMHIVTTNIQVDGKRISLHNLGKTKSEEARKHIEERYGLVRASARAVKESISVLPVNAQKVIYGKMETKRAITNVLEKVIPLYKYTSLAELNAVLQLYNVRADRGRERSRLYENGGLLYRVLDEKANPVGIPIKASAIYNRPTLKNLEKRFKCNEEQRKPNSQRIKTVIDWTLHSRKLTFQQLKNGLKKEAIDVVIRANQQGIAYGITYVDHKTKCVFNGSDLGKGYALKAIFEKCPPAPAESVENVKHVQRPLATANNLPGFPIQDAAAMPPEPQPPPPELRVDRKKKKRRRIRL